LILNNLASRQRLAPGSQVITGGAHVYSSMSGEKISKETAATCSAIYAAVRILGGTFGKLSRTVSKEQNGNWLEYRKHWAYPLIANAPNSYQSAPQFFRHMLTHTFMTGDSYAYIDWDGGRRAKQLIPMNPDLVTVYQGPAPNYEIIYGFRPTQPGTHEMFFKADEILHWPSLFSLNGITGMSMIEAAAHAIGLNISETQHASANLKGGARPSGVIEYPNKLGDDQYKKIQKSLEDFHGGSKNAGKVLILHNDAKWHSIGFSNQQLELIEERKFSIADISRFTGIPLFMLGQEDSSSYNSNEQHMLAYVMLVLDPWVHDFDVLLNNKLMLFSDRKEYEISTKIEEFSRADTTSQSASDATGKQWGWMTTNDIRRRKKLPPAPPEIGDVYWRPVNYVPADTPVAAPPAVIQNDSKAPQIEEKPPENVEKPAEKKAKQAKRSLKPAFDDAFERIDRQIRLFREKKGDNPEKLGEFFKEKRSVFAEMLTPAVMSAGLFLIDDFTEATRLDLEVRTDKMIGKLIDTDLSRELIAEDHFLNSLVDYIEVRYGNDG
jgi:HK97 family phage portal protein